MISTTIFHSEAFLGSLEKLACAARAGPAGFQNGYRPVRRGEAPCAVRRAAAAADCLSVEFY
jgi:hypothetical protein